MKVGDLIKQLQNLPEDMDIILQKDSEGNGYSPLEGLDSDAIYIPETTWSGEVYTTNWDAEDANMEEKEWEELKKNNKKCCVLYPIN